MAGAQPGVKVWDRVVRVGHWLLVASVAAAWLTHEGARNWHEAIGYVSLAVVVLRIAWGFYGSRFARFAQFVRSPRATLRYARLVLSHEEPRHLGHNPLGARMVLLLLAWVAAIGLTGWLYTTDAFWGEAWLEELHGLLGDAVFVLVGLHVAGVLFTSWRQRENLVAAMFSGRKPAPRDGDVS